MGKEIYNLVIIGIESKVTTDIIGIESFDDPEQARIRMFYMCKEIFHDKEMMSKIGDAYIKSVDNANIMIISNDGENGIILNIVKSKFHQKEV